MKIDMSPQAVTNRMNMLDQLWELAVALKSSDILNSRRVEETEANRNKEKDEQKPVLKFGGDDKSRTCDLCIANAALCQLSYIPMYQTKS